LHRIHAPIAEADQIPSVCFRASQRLVVTRVIVDAANHPSDDTCTLPAM